MPPSRSLRQQRQDVNSSPLSSSHCQRHQKKTVLPVVTPKIEVSIPSLSRNHWHKAKQLRNLWRANQIEYRFPALSFSALLKSPPYNSKKKWTTQEREAVKNRCILVERRIAVWYDGKENKLMQYLPEFIRENLAVSVESEIRQLIATIDPPTPAGTRYKRFLDWKASLLGKPCGVYAYTVYPKQGQPQGIPGPSGDSAGKPGEVVGAACKFRLSTSIIELSTELSLALAALDKPICDRFRGNVIAAKKEWGVLDAEDRCETQCFIGIFVLVNVFTDEHVDDNDVPDGWAAMAVLGKFHGAPLYIPELRVKITHQRRDVIFFRSRILQHLSEEFEAFETDGRYVLVFTNDARTFKYLSEHYTLVFSKHI